MKVLLKEDVYNLGYAGDLVDVADGYGRNYLLPRNLAVKATPGVLKEAQAWRDRAAARRAQMRNEHQALAGRISAARLVFHRRAGEKGKLYGSITHGDIADELNKVLGITIDRRSVLGEPLRQLGEHRVVIRLSPDVQPQVVVHVYAEGASALATPAAAEMEATEEMPAEEILLEEELPAEEEEVVVEE
ncbi:MAG: 50S ribosomal protein L9 [Chloroflexi bacterium]|nr:50S ribosomal protein L9 [Chloroflexota bacterium]MCI0577546.1 50S ribosomal protein L9 [Chloroflexota bacterium]MCI0645615.1 50S ribosomal protein L9 [Chloroflexota bacterium]MCI0725527.1 50S ribosomal protein L9 [Chloroflexota bacterium]